MARPTDGRMQRAVQETLRSVPNTPELAALRQMVREYARQMDTETTAGRGVDAYHKLGPRLQAALRELGATPAGGRAGSRGGTGGISDELAAARARAATRGRRAAGVDPATSDPDP